MIKIFASLIHELHNNFSLLILKLTISSRILHLDRYEVINPRIMFTLCTIHIDFISFLKKSISRNKSSPSRAINMHMQTQNPFLIISLPPSTSNPIKSSTSTSTPPSFVSRSPWITINVYIFCCRRFEMCRDFCSRQKHWSCNNEVPWNIHNARPLHCTGPWRLRKIRNDLSFRGFNYRNSKFPLVFSILKSDVAWNYASICFQ